MRLTWILSLIIILVICGSCNDNSNSKTINAIRRNNYDLPSPNPTKVHDILILLPAKFSVIKVDPFSFNSTSTVAYQYKETNQVISIQKFSKANAMTLIDQNYIEEESELLSLQKVIISNLLANMYDTPQVSIPLSIYDKTKKKGVMQTVKNSGQYNTYNTSFFVATINFKDNYYALLMSTSDETAPYMYDDFLEIIKSIK